MYDDNWGFKLAAQRTDSSCLTNYADGINIGALQLALLSGVLLCFFTKTVVYPWLFKAHSTDDISFQAKIVWSGQTY